MDATDKKILRILQQNAKQNTKEIASQIGLTVSPTFERIKRLEQQGYIKQYVALLDKNKIGQSIEAYCQVSLAQHSKVLIDSFKQEFTVLEEVLGCFHVSGTYDFLLHIIVEDMNAYQRFVVEKLAIIEGISNIQSSFVMESVKNETAYPIK